MAKDGALQAIHSPKPSLYQHSWHGILLLDKPTGMSSNKALQIAKRACGVKKAGHTGSLDPLASGMLPLCFGQATKFSQHLLTADKQYEVVMRLGVRTDTADAEGRVIAQAPVKDLQLSQLQQAVDHFKPGYAQVPPMYSALKHQGKRLYELARKGVEVQRKSRQVHFSELKISAFTADILQLKVTCSKGTYIRSLVDDIGQYLGCGAHVIVLRRTVVGPFQSRNMLTLAGLKALSEQAKWSQIRSYILAVDALFAHLPVVQAMAQQIKRLQMGQRLPQYALNSHDTGPVRLLDEAGRMVGLGEMTVDGRFKLDRMLHFN